MIVYGVYVVSEDGRTLVSENFQSDETLPNEILLGGLFTALQGVAAEVSRNESELKSIEIEGLSYHIRSFGFYRVILVTNVPTSLNEDIIQTLGLRFMKEFGEKLIEAGGRINLREFSPFKKIIHEIIQPGTVSDESKSIKPSKILSTGEIFSLPHHLQSTALAMISIEEGSIEEIARESKNSNEDAEKYVIELKNMGYVGKKDSQGKTIYFCSL
ncbi:MAG: hypothetical protein ACFFD4_28330 [Candidatus Odinarchaeota archaeon]